MGKAISLLKTEIKNVYMQTILFLLISIFMFAFSSGMLTFASDMRRAFGTYMDNNCPAPLCVYIDDTQESDLTKIIKHTDTLLSEIITDGMFVHDDNYVSSENAPGGFSYPMGQGCMTKDVPLEEQGMVMLEGAWEDFRDEKYKDGSYSIILSKAMAEMLDVHVGDNVAFSLDAYRGDEAGISQTVKVAGVFDDVSSPYKCFYVSLSCIYTLKGNASIRLLAYINRPSDSLSVIPKLTSLGCKVVSAGWPIEANSTVLTMEAILYAVAIFFVIATCFILGSILTITLHTRWEYIAKLKLLGAPDGTITALYFIWLLLIMILAIVAGVVISIFLCNYLSQIGGLILNYPITITFHASVGAIVGGVSILVFVVQYFIFRRKIKKISAIGLAKEE